MHWNVASPFLEKCGQVCTQLLGAVLVILQCHCPVLAAATKKFSASLPSSSCVEKEACVKPGNGTPVVGLGFVNHVIGSSLPSLCCVGLHGGRSLPPFLVAASCASSAVPAPTSLTTAPLLPSTESSSPASSATAGPAASPTSATDDGPAAGASVSGPLGGTPSATFRGGVRRLALSLRSFSAGMSNPSNAPANARIKLHTRVHTNSTHAITTSPRRAKESSARSALQTSRLTNELVPRDYDRTHLSEKPRGSRRGRSS